MARDRAATDRLTDALSSVRRPLILTHDNPDPDALASAFGMKELLAGALHLDATVAFSGIIGRAENRAMVRELELMPEPLSTLDLSEFDGALLVDAQPETGNASLPADVRLLAVVDHHPPHLDASSLPFVDIRDDYGATATILVEYARALEVEFSRPAATALFYALKSETQDLGREAGSADRDAYLGLLERADMAAVARIQRARVPREYFRAFRDAIERAEIRGRAVVTDLGAVGSPDIVAEIADFLLRLQGMDWSCCLGRHQNQIVLSVRTSDPGAHAGGLVRRVARDIGTAGGHGSMAGAQVPIRGDAYEETLEQVRARLLAELEVIEADSESIVRATSD